MGFEYTIGNVKVSQLSEFGVHARDAMGFLVVAIQLDQCKSGTDREKLSALESNLQLWVGVQTLLADRNNQMTDSLKAQITKLSGYIINKIFALDGAVPGEELLDHFINLNLQMSEGLLESGMNEG